MSPPETDCPFARLLAARAADGSSGIITATRGKLKRLFCLREGWIVFAASNLTDEQLDECLVRHGDLEPAERSRAAAEGAKEGKSIIDVLLARGVLRAEQVRGASLELLQSLVSSCLEWPDGEFSFEPGTPNLAEQITVRSSPAQLLLRHARHFPRSLDAVRTRIGPPDFRPRATGATEHLFETSRPSDVMSFLLERCDGSVPVGQLLGLSPADEEKTLRAIYALLLVGALETPEARADRPTVKGGDAPLTEEGCLALLRRSERLDHYGILGVQHDSRAEEIRDAYHALARRYHPDRFRSGDLQHLLSPMEDYFTKVTEAYNTLSDPDRRSDYDTQRAERESKPAAPAGADRAHLARQNFLRAKELLRRRRLADAVSFLENAISLDDAQAEYHLELGQLLSGNPRRRDDAEKHLLRVVSLAPATAAAYLALGRLYRKRGRDEEAARMFRETLRWDPQNAEAGSELAEMDRDEASSQGTRLRDLFRG